MNTGSVKEKRKRNKTTSKLLLLIFFLSYNKTNFCNAVEKAYIFDVISSCIFSCFRNYRFTLFNDDRIIAIIDITIMMLTRKFQKVQRKLFVMHYELIFVFANSQPFSEYYTAMNNYGLKHSISLISSKSIDHSWIY